MGNPASLPAPRVCIVVPFTIWNDLVEECVAHCLALDYPDFVLALLPDEAAAVPGEMEADGRVVVLPSSSHIMSVKRNLALRHCRDAELFACIDSDAYPDRDWLKNAATVLGSRPEAWMCSGPNLSPDYDEPSRRAVAAALKSPLVGASRAYMKRRGEKDRFVDDIWTCNAFLLPQVRDELGGFDEDLYTAEDTDLARRVLAHGERLYYSDSLVVHHHNRPLGLPFVKQKLVAGHGALRYVRKHFGPHVLFCFAPVLALVFFATGWATVFFWELGFRLWLVGIAVYLVALIVEAFRWSRKLTDAPLTFLAILVGNLTPGVGLSLALLGIPLPARRLYVNYQPEHVTPSTGSSHPPPRSVSPSDRRSGD